MARMITPYKGGEPYIFISYSHRNKVEAEEIICRLCNDNYRVWYDEGIDPGTEWDENIASHIEECGYFIALLSKEYLESSNCKDELNYARELEKPRLLVYLKDVQLPGGMHMRLSRLQAIHKYKYDSNESFVQKLEETDGLDLCREQDYIEYDGVEYRTDEDAFCTIDCPMADIRLLFVVDTSGSMHGERINALNDSLTNAYDRVKSKYGDRVGIDILQYDTFASWREIKDLPLSAYGTTNYGTALRRLVDYGTMIPIDSECVIIFISDGYPTDSYHDSLKILRNEKWFSCSIKIALSIGETNLDDLIQIVDTPTAVIEVENNLSSILPAYSASAVDAAVLRHTGRTYIDGRNICEWSDNLEIDVPGKWNITEDGTLYIRGAIMMDYYRPEPDVPWKKFREKIKKIVIGNGMRIIGMQAFYNLPNLEEVVIPSSVTDIRPYAFAECPKLERVSIGRKMFEVKNYYSEVKHAPRNSVIIWMGVFDNTAYQGDINRVPGTDYDY